MEHVAAAGKGCDGHDSALLLDLLAKDPQDIVVETEDG
jgi:hypothetical protein